MAGRKYHILIISAWFPGSAGVNGIFVKEQAEALARAGHHVTMFHVTYRTIGKWLRDLLSGKKETFDTSGVCTFLHFRVVFPFFSRMKKDPASAQKNYIREKACKYMSRYAKSAGIPDLIHHHCLSDNAYITEALSELWGIPYFFTEHSNYASDEELNKFNSFESFSDRKRFVTHAAVRIAVSRVWADVYASVYGSPFVVVPNMVNPVFERPLPGVKASRPFRLICIANLDKNKRQDLLLNAFARAFTGQDVQLQLVGTGYREAEYRALAARLGLSGRVEFCGRKNREELIQMLDHAHACLLVSEKETFGIALVEAMFRGLPVISTRSGGPEEIVTPASGLLCENGNENALIKAMQELIRNYSSYNASLIREDAITHYSESRIVERLEEIYADPVAEKHSSGS